KPQTLGEKITWTRGKPEHNQVKGVFSVFRSALEISCRPAHLPLIFAHRLIAPFLIFLFHFVTEIGTKPTTFEHLLKQLGAQELLQGGHRGLALFTSKAEYGSRR